MHLFTRRFWLITLVITVFFSTSSAQESTTSIEPYPHAFRCPAISMEALYLVDDPNVQYSLTSGTTRALVPEVATFISREVFGYDPGYPLRVNYVVDYFGGVRGEGESIPVRFYVLVNEEFQPVGDDGSLYRDMEMPYQARSIFQFDLPPFEEGLHDIVILGLPDIAAMPTTYHDRDRIELFSYRFTLVVGNPPLEPEDLRPYVVMSPLPPTPEDQDAVDAGRKRLELLLSLSDAPVLWSWPDETLKTAPNESFTFNAQIGPTRYFTHYDMFTDYESSHNAYGGDIPFDTDTRRFALVALQNYEPVQLGQDTTAFYGETAADAWFVQHPITLTAPESGRQDIVVVRIDNPGVPICQKWASTPDGVYARRAVVEAVPEQ